MVDVHIHPNIDPMRARVSKKEQSTVLKIEGERGYIMIYGGKDSAPALQMIADIFNDAFGTVLD